MYVFLALLGEENSIGKIQINIYWNNDNRFSFDYSLKIATKRKKEKRAKDLVGLEAQMSIMQQKRKEKEKK